MKIEIEQVNTVVSNKPSPYWLAVYGPKFNLPSSGDDICSGDTPDPTECPFVLFSKKPSQQDIKDGLGEGEILLVVLKVTP